MVTVPSQSAATLFCRLAFAGPAAQTGIDGLVDLIPLAGIALVALGGETQFLRLAQHITAAPDGLDIIVPAAGEAQLLAKLADEDVDDLELGLVHAAVMPTSYSTRTMCRV